MTTLKDLEKVKKLTPRYDDGAITAIRLVQGYNDSYSKNTEGGITALSLSDSPLESFELDDTWRDLEYLYLSGNQSLKRVVFYTALPKLTHLYLDNCALEEITIPAGFAALKQMYVQKNKLKKVIFEGDCPALELVDASNNESLTEFSMRVIFKNMAYLYLVNNEKIANIPSEIIKNEKNCWGKVKAYLQEFIKGAEVNKRAKMILVGNGRVGKTSLYRRLKGLVFNEKEPYTHGIQIGYLDKKSLPKAKTEELQLNVWDFGGQEIFYATHQFFLTKDAIYILAWTNEKNVKAHRERDKENPLINDVFRPTEYWLDNIRLHGKESPIIMVQTHFANADNRLMIEPHFQSVYRVMPLNFDARTDFSLSELKILIEEKLNTDIQGYGQEIASTYVDVIERVEAHKSQGDKKLTKDQFFSICKDAKIDSGSELAVLDYLNQIGVVVYFDKDKLNDTIFIDANWLTQEVYKLINPRLQDGKITEDYLRAHLPDYDKEQQEQFMQLLDSFDLVFKVKQENYWIAPQYLPEKLEGFAKTFYDSTKKDLALAFSYRFERFMPENVIINFISRYGPYSDKCYFKTGIHFRDDNEVKCVVEFNESLKSLMVYLPKTTSIESKKLQKEIFDAFRELSKEAEAEVSVDGNTYTSLKLVAENIEDYKENPHHFFRCHGNKIYLKDYALLLGLERGELLSTKNFEQVKERSTPDVNTPYFENGYALLVGIGYEGLWNNRHRLKGTINDIKDLSTLLLNPQKAAYKPNNVISLLEKEATTQGILKALNDLAQKTYKDPEATVIIYYSGHGVTDGKMSYLVPFDYRGIAQPHTCISSKEFAQKIAAIQAKKLLVILDCCHSENIAVEKNLDDSSDFLTQLVADLNTEFDTPSVSEKTFSSQTIKSGGGRVIITSCETHETSLDIGSNGLFTAVLLNCLNGEDNLKKDGWVRLEDLMQIRTIVPKEAAKHIIKGVSHQQHPMFKRIDNLTHEEFIICAYDIAKAKNLDIQPIDTQQHKLTNFTDLDDFKKELRDHIDNNEFSEVFSKIKNGHCEYEKSSFVKLEREFSFNISLSLVDQLKIFIGTLRSKR